MSLVLAAPFATGAPAGRASAGDGRISVTALSGDVAVTMAGRPAQVRVDSTLVLPTRIVTGGDGVLGFTQAGTNVTVANDSEVEIPAEAVDGNLIARLVQHHGNVFYDVAKRDVGKLRVETPLLVAVIKGTQFNVAVAPDSTTISLFEGRLEIRTPDGSDVIDLEAGEIAIRSRVDDSIRVVGMNDRRVAAPRAEGLAAVAGDSGTAARVTELAADLGLVAVDRVRADGTSLAVDPRLDGGAVEAKATTVTLDGGALTTSSLDLGAVAAVAPIATGIDLSVGSADVALDTRVDLGAASVSANVAAGLDVSAGSVDVGVGAGVDLGGAANIGGQAAIGLDLGGADLTTDATVDAGLGGIDAGLDLALDPQSGVDAGAALDLGGLNLDASLDLGGAGVGLELDLTAEEDTVDTATAEPAPAPLPLPRGGLLGGLL